VSSRAVLVSFLAVIVVAAAAPATAGDGEREIARAAADAQKAWYDRSRERPDLVPGAFEVLRFPTGWQWKPRYRHDPKNPKRLLDPDFYCSRCVREKRIPPASDRRSHRLMQRDEPQVLSWIERELEVSSSTLIEDDTFKLWSELPGANLRDQRQGSSPFLKEEMSELGDVFPEVSEKTVAVDDHERAHLYLIRAHRLLRDFWWLAGTDPDALAKDNPYLGPYLGMKSKLEIYLFQTKRDYESFLDWYIGSRTASDGLCWHLLQDGAMVLAMHGENQSDPAIVNFFFHRLMHDLIDGYRGYQFKLPAWFQMGFGSWVERRENALFNTFCFSEGTMPAVLYSERWLPKVKKVVQKGRVTPFVEACTHTEYGDFPPEYHMIAYSLVCYQLSLGPEKMRIFLNALKGKKTEESIYQAQVRAFREAYGVTMLQFEEGWKRWVSAVYPEV
jgi:hypothetical protein